MKATAKALHIPVIVARKPLSEATVAANVLRWGTGAINVDACRIPGSIPVKPQPRLHHASGIIMGAGIGRNGEYSRNIGRWPANTVYVHHPDCRQIGTKKVKGQAPAEQPMKASNGRDYGKYDTGKTAIYGHGDSEGNETVAAWECTEGCPVKALDEQSGIGESHKNNIPVHSGTAWFGGGRLTPDSSYADTGGASRFFNTFAYDESDDESTAYNTKAGGMSYIIYPGDNLETFQNIPDNSIDACITDPPYGLGEVKDISAYLLSWMQGGTGLEHTTGKGFMGKEWDAGVPGPVYWKEVYRVLKPGAHLLCFAGTRTADLMSIAIRLAGFEIRDEIDCNLPALPSRLSWTYGSGFPKSLNISKAIDRKAGAEREVIGKGRYADRGRTAHQVTHALGAYSSSMDDMLTAPATDEAKQLEGWGTALKPAHEPVIVARKPIAADTIAENVLEYGTGAINIDACRAGTEIVKTEAKAKGQSFTSLGAGEGFNGCPESYHQGRWPANTVFVHHPECKQIGTRKVKGDAGGMRKAGTEIWNFHDEKEAEPTIRLGHADEDGYETIPAWECTEGCPIKALDEQSGERKSGGKVKGNEPSRTCPNGIYGARDRVENAPHEDAGGASRFFNTFSYDEPEPVQTAGLPELDVPFRYVAKASRRERNEGLEDLPLTDSTTRNFMTTEWIIDPRSPNGGYKVNPSPPKQNHHPTVKPVALLKWLCQLVTPPGGTVLDPFTGSGTTGIAAVELGFNFIGMEREPDFARIADQRIAYAIAKQQGLIQPKAKAKKPLIEVKLKPAKQAEQSGPDTQDQDETGQLKLEL